MSARWDGDDAPPVQVRDFVLGLLFLLVLVGLMRGGSALGMWIAGPTA